MTAVTFFFDPLCPWSWRTSVWIREVQRQEPLDIRWRFFSLALANDYAADRPQALAPLRVAALAGHEGGNDAVDRVYIALGKAIHDEGVNTRVDDVLARAIPAALESAGLDPDLYRRAMEDQTTLDVVTADYQEARDRYAAFGVPWLILDGHDPGFFGPVINPPPEGREALDLWHHTMWMLARPYLYELKRERT